MGLAVLLIGYGSFAVIVIRSDANTPLDENDPENLVNLHSYLKREQYGSAPLLKGPYWNSTPAEVGGDFSPTYVRRFVVEKDGEVVKAFQKEIVKENIDQLNKTEFKDLYKEDSHDKEYVKDVTIDSDFELLFPDDYINELYGEQDAGGESC